MHGPEPDAPGTLDLDEDERGPDAARPRRGGVSGLYVGRGGGVTVQGQELHLRLDVDRRYSATSPVLDTLSGDVYLHRPVLADLTPGPGAARTVRTYLHSWVVDSPTVVWRRTSVEVTGTVRYWQGLHPLTTVAVVVPWRGGVIGPAQVTFARRGVRRSTFLCALRSDSFRTVDLEIDRCSSVAAAPLVPRYDTHAHAVRPVDTALRELTIEEAYREAGVEITRSTAPSVLDDSDPGFATWSPAELHDAMETAFSGFPSTWPSWHMWGLLAGSYEEATTGGIMFDAAASFGGAGEGPDRQGFAVFRNHPWFRNLVDRPAVTQAEAFSMRQFLYTWVHEAGHAFNFLHSWNKARPDALSWMNYPQRYDARNGTDAFWSSFRFRFDDEELLHLRHGDRAAVIMGGDPWASGGHLESPPDATAETAPDSAVELLVRTQGYVELMEPVQVELRLRNASPSPLELDVRLDPRHGVTTVLVRRPDGRTVVFDPVVCEYGLPRTAVLEPLAADASNQGEDRYSAVVPLTFGTRGFLFDAPGEYLIRAAYHGGGLFLTSPAARLRVGRPMSREEDRLAHEWFTREVGLSLVLDGSQSPTLGAGMATLRDAAELLPGTELAAQAAVTVARSVGRDFYRRVDDRMVQAHAADPDAALQLTAPALALYQRSGDAAHNLPYHQVVDLRTDLNVEAERSGAAREELLTLADDLAARGANAPVVDDVRSRADRLG
ncbi:hypothetical protein ACWFNE_14080 [Cellulomonas sp. NPDC055163]